MQHLKEVHIWLQKPKVLEPVFFPCHNMLLSNTNITTTYKLVHLEIEGSTKSLKRVCFTT
jgi:hypothetical protein